MSAVLYFIVIIGGYLFNAWMIGKVAFMFFADGLNWRPASSLLFASLLALVWPATLIFLLFLAIFMSTARPKEQR